MLDGFCGRSKGWPLSTCVRSSAPDDLPRRSSTMSKLGNQIIRVALVIAFLAGAMSSFVSIAKADEATDDYNLAISLFNQDRMKAAADQFRDYLAKHARHEKAALARLYLGLTLERLEDYKAAREELKKFVNDHKTNPNVPQAQYRIGECSYFLDDFESAKVELADFIKNQPKDPLCEYALSYLGDSYLRLKTPVEALKSFELGMEQFPDGKLVDDLKFGRARALESLKRYDDAIKQYQELAQRKDGSHAADAAIHLGASYFERKQYPEAIAAYGTFISDFPKHALVPTAHLNTGYAYYQSSQFAEAAKQFETIQQDKTQGATATLWLARSWKSLGDYQKAITVLSSATLPTDNPSAAESIVYEHALCLRLDHHPEESKVLFNKVLADYPKGPLADDALYALTEMAIESGDLVEAEQRLARYTKEYSQSNLRLHFDMLSGRLDLARAAGRRRDEPLSENQKALYGSAGQKFEHVMNDSSNPRTKRQARYYLALTRQLQDDPTKALELMQPLVELAMAEGARNDFVDVIVMQADCYFQQQRFDQAVSSATNYLNLVSSGRQVARALAVQIQAAEKLKDSKLVDASLARLAKDFPKHPLTIATLQQLAEDAEGKEDWVSSGRYYEALLLIQEDPERRRYTLRGLALALYYQQNYSAAAEAFGKIATDSPQHELALEATYYQAESLMKAKQTEQALALFDKLLAKVPEDKPAEPGAETKPPLEYSYKAGRWIAVLLTAEKKLDEANAAYEALLKRFPKPADLDKRLYEWAFLNHDNQRYEQADVIWKRLLAETPNSPHANEAKVNLADSAFDANRIEEARTAFVELADNETSTPIIKEWSLSQLVRIAVDQEKWDDVKTYGERLVKDFPESSQRFYVDYSRAEMHLSKSQPAAEDLKAARELLESLRANRGNEDLKKAIWYDRIWVLLAEVDLLEKQYDNVTTVVEELRQASPESRYLYQADEILGRSFKQQAPPKFAEAREAFERVLANTHARRTETAAQAQFLIGETFLLQENWRQAFVAYQKVYSLYKYPELQAAALMQSARCDERQNDWKPAIKTYQRLITEFPDFSRMEEVKTLLQAAQKHVSG